MGFLFLKLPPPPCAALLVYQQYSVKPKPYNHVTLWKTMTISVTVTTVDAKRHHKHCILYCILYPTYIYNIQVNIYIYVYIYMWYPPNMSSVFAPTTTSTSTIRGPGDCRLRTLFAGLVGQPAGHTGGISIVVPLAYWSHCFSQSNGH
jgi:hypothetical protein